MNIKIVAIIILFSLCILNFLKAQEKSEIPNYCCNPNNLKLLGDSARNWRFTDIRPTEKFDILFNKGFEIFSPVLDTGNKQYQSLLINNISSGTNFIGLSFNWILTPKIAIKVQPGFSFYSIIFNQKFNILETQEFIKEDILRIRFNCQYFEVPIGLNYIVIRDNRKRLIFYTELGATLGVKTGSSLHIAFSKLNNVIQPELSIGNIPEVNIWRGGFYTKIIYRILGIWAFYKFSDFFTESRNNYRLPQLGRLELGFTFVL
ncbi:MAG: hypothetical protein RML72_12290 [Bacteroidia bacterium]|nr:hypothetical protein [Bacteroidia bacterium]MDW8159637.1 hypothetical protein [Bacteroidia bacterium]